MTSISAAVRIAAEERVAGFERATRAAAVAAGEGRPDDFVRHAGLLAGHAALPVAFDPGFLHLLRVNFFMDRQPLPYWIEARLLLSPLCRPVGDDLYEMDAVVRDLLLARLAAESGAVRLRQVATLLWQYTERHPRWADRRELRHAQQLTALNFLQEEDARAWLDAAEHGVGSGSLAQEWFVAMRGGLQELPSPPQASLEPREVALALATLGFRQQRIAFSQALTTAFPTKFFVVIGPRDFGHEWLMDVLLLPGAFERLDVKLGEGLWADGGPAALALDSALGRADTVRTAGSHVAMIDRDRRIALVARIIPGDASSLNEFVSQLARRRLRDGLQGLFLVFLVVEGGRGTQPAGPDPFDQPGLKALPPLEAITTDELHSWLASTPEPLRSILPSNLTDTTASIMQATGGVPERVLQRLCVIYGVRWPDVQVAMRRPLQSRAPDRVGQMLALGREYVERRRALPRGAERDAVMHAIADRMRAVFIPTDSWPLIEWAMPAATDEQRLAATIVLQRKPLAQLLPWLAERLHAEVPFAGHQAALALLEAARHLPVQDLGDVRTAIKFGLHGLRPGKDNTERGKTLREADRVCRARRPPPARRLQTKRARAWPAGTAIPIAFLDGSQRLQARVRGIAEEWLRHAHLRFRWVKSLAGAQIRITFKEAGNWSYLGTDALNIPAHDPTMSLGSLEQTTPEETFRQVVLSEFGHALGLINEHLNPNAKIPWNEDAVMRALTGPPNHWTPEVVRANVLRPDRGGNFGPYRSFDPKSIMLHTFPAEWLRNKRAIGGATTLSESDKQFIAELYPGKPQGEPRGSTTLSKSDDPFIAAVYQGKLQGERRGSKAATSRTQVAAEVPSRKVTRKSARKRARERKASRPSRGVKKTARSSRPESRNRLRKK